MLRRFHFLLFGLFILSLAISVSLPAISTESNGYLNQENKSVESLVNSANDGGKAENLLEQGKQFYQAGQFSNAAQAWQSAASNFADLKDTLNQARASTMLSLALQQLGQWQSAKEAISKSLNLLNNSQAKNQNSALILAQALNAKGNLELALGNAEEALAIWQQAAATYTKGGDRAGAIGSLINQTQAMQSLGLYRRASTTLQEVEQTLQKEPDSLLKSIGLRSLGNALRQVGDLKRSREILQQSLEIAKRLQSTPDIGETLLSLGNTSRIQQDAAAALKFYRETASTSTSELTQVQARLNELSLLLEQKRLEDAKSLFGQIQSQVSNLPATRAGIYARINLAQSMKNLLNKNDLPDAIDNGKLTKDMAQLLVTSVQQAESLKDARAKSYALGNLGSLYRENQQWSDAKELTEEALSIAQAINAGDIAYQWQWQLGRLLQKEGKIKDAIAAYTEAVNTLQSLRSDLVAINQDVQFSFRDSVEPVYRELVGLLLQPDNQSQETTIQNRIMQARSVIESLQLAELDNFFRESCLDSKPVQIDRIDRTAAVIYPIILADRLEVILSIPGQPLRHYATAMPNDKVESSIDQLRQSLSPVASTSQRLRLSQQFYDWLIRPAEADLAKNGIQTLVFVPDGLMRNLPMAVLYDGNQFLVEKYRIAVTPGLQLLEPKALMQRSFRVLTAGLTEARQNFSALPAVKTELSQISAEVPSTVLLNGQFTSNGLQKEIKETAFPVVHLATHGQFSSNAEETFILTWDNKINVKEFDELLEVRLKGEPKPIELLVLSACQTATGDKRAALGLAGIAVRSGARSTIASLWSVNDAATSELMAQFYRELSQTGISKAEALRRAQLNLLKNTAYKHPFYWAPFVLVGNWL
ncbi:CHAT domain-containing protein [Planktothrix sp. FACHB-1355]|uniref:CHAT domain-containing protein n=1 Tax=Aerosakkonema funiforme FACHB-1375 TaxID=2949571 RepID=A0A926VBB6_9CYAN|nr:MULTISPECIES: CHAT domain-containing protein [Oscillatoriales]MBD2179787.1 CHAT domain-containing protein [Aerosakkonema funiforme FACHB-1375]MBD3559464.1 CHAT domain-containing protein [Planktothrix sp. FACHB-1355]